jgi:hypothetical protein
MDYSINQNTVVQEGNGSTIIPIGINEECKIVGWEVKEANNGSIYLWFGFANKDGATLSHTEWDVDPDRVTPKAGETQEEAADRKLSNLLQRIKHICTKFVEPSNFAITATDWKSLCESVCKTLEKNKTAALATNVRLKVTYSWNDYASLPNYCPFIENIVEVPVSESKLKMNNIDKLEKAAAVASTEAMSSDEPILPF